MSSLWNTILYQPLVNALVFLYELFFSNLGLAIIALTALIRLAMVPLTLPSLKASQKMKELSPELAKLKKQYGSDRQAFANAQLGLYKKHGANPAAGCLPQIVQLVVLIALFQAFRQVLAANGDTLSQLNDVLYGPLKLSEGTTLNTRFLYLDLTKPDLFPLPEKFLGGLLPGIPGLFLIGSALAQFWSSKMMAPVVKSAEKAAKKTPTETDDMATAMQKQMLYLFPLMTIVIGFSFPSGLVLYWFIFSAFSIVQQLWMQKKAPAKAKATV